MRALLFFSVMVLSVLSYGQRVENANVYPSNLEENMYFERFNPSTSTLEGLHFLVLSDGNNSRHVTPAFEVSLYLLPEGSTSRDDLIVVKRYNLDGIYHFGSHEFKNEVVNLNETPGIQPGNYRLGIWVNSNEAFDEDRSDNATLFRKPITLTQTTSGAATPTATSTTQQPMAEVEEEKDDEDDDWGNWDDDEW